MKAFLSHSWSDAEFVRAVADELGRQFTWLDVHAFDTGDNFIAGMEEGIRDSSVFVLFASRRALESVNVQFEVTEAKRAMIAQALERAMVFIIDPGVTYRDLPAWLQRAKVSEVNAPKPTARAIRSALDEAARTRQRAIFVGRSRERAQIESRLFPSDGAPAPRILILSGLPGIGRRSLLERVANDHWNLRPTVQIRIESGDILADLVVKLADRFEPYNSIDAFRSIAGRIQIERPEELRARLATYLSLAVGNHELPVIVDDGGLLNNEGTLTETAQELLGLVTASPSLYMAFVTRRRPLAPSEQYPCVSIPALPTPEAKQLVAGLASRAQLTLVPAAIEAIADAAEGYPPSIHHGVELVRDYGADVALADGQRMTASRMIPLLQYLRAVSLERMEREILRILAAVSPLPMQVIGNVVDGTPAQVAPIIGRLIDSSLVVPDDLGYYWLAPPMRVVVVRELRDLDKNGYAQVADALEAHLERDGEDGSPRLDVARGLYRAHTLADDDAHRDAAFALASDWISAAESLYHRRDYRKAAEVASNALTARPRNYDARFTLVRALIKLGEFGLAETEIESLRQANYLRESSFLNGLLQRHKGDTRSAIRSYEAALERGYRGMAIHRELAQCHLDLGQIPDAKHHAEQALRLGADNRYLIDLQIKIAVLERDEQSAISKLEMLKTVDRPEFYHHRASTVHSAFGRNTQALEHARNAMAQVGRPTPAMLSQISMCEVRNGLLDEAAEHIRRLDTEFPNQHQDIRVGLKCLLETARYRYADALVLWNQLRRKEKPVHLVLKRNILAGLLTGALPDALRAEYSRELGELNAQLAGRLNAEFAMLDEDI